MLAVDGGTPPAPPADPPKPGAPPLGPGAPAPLVAPGAPVPEDPGWARETVRALVGVPFLIAHLWASRRGPGDAWLPSDSELDVMAAPLHNIAQRSLRLRALARFGDGVAFVASTGTYTTAESRRIARWRAAHAADAPAPPDSDIAGLSVTATKPTEPAPASAPHAADGVRPWRPPSVPPEGA